MKRIHVTLIYPSSPWKEAHWLIAAFLGFNTAYWLLPSTCFTLYFLLIARAGWTSYYKVELCFLWYYGMVLILLKLLLWAFAEKCQVENTKWVRRARSCRLSYGSCWVCFSLLSSSANTGLCSISLPSPPTKIIPTTCTYRSYKILSQSKSNNEILNTQFRSPLHAQSKTMPSHTETLVRSIASPNKMFVSLLPSSTVSIHFLCAQNLPQGCLSVLMSTQYGHLSDPKWFSLWSGVLQASSWISTALLSFPLKPEKLKQNLTLSLPRSH